MGEHLPRVHVTAEGPYFLFQRRGLPRVARFLLIIATFDYRTYPNRAMLHRLGGGMALQGVACAQAKVFPPIAGQLGSLRNPASQESIGGGRSTHRVRQRNEQRRVQRGQNNSAGSGDSPSTRVGALGIRGYQAALLRYKTGCTTQQPLVWGGGGGD